MFYLVFFLLLLGNLFANNHLTSVTENDPSSIVEGVSVIRGNFYTYKEIYEVQGVEPIRFRQTYVSSGFSLNGFEHLIANFELASGIIHVVEPNGTATYYVPEDETFREIGDSFFLHPKKKKRKKDSIRYLSNLFINESKGISNTSTGNISGQTHLKNQYIVFDRHKDAKGKSFTLYAADGAKRRYTNFENQGKEEIPYSGLWKNDRAYNLYKYKLISEDLPNGHAISYQWNHKNELECIRTTNASNTKTFARISCPPISLKNPPTQIAISGSDGQVLKINRHPTAVKNLFVTSEISSPSNPNLSYGWTSKKHLIGYDILDYPYMSSISLPQGRTLYIDYEDTGNRRVRTLSSPVGKDATPIVTHRFYYHQNYSYVDDVKGNRTLYRWDENERLTRIERYLGTEKLYNEERYVWSNSFLSCKYLLDQNRNCIHVRQYEYDGFGNPVREIFLGNLSGECSAPLEISPNSFPSANGVESYARTTVFTQDGKHLPLREETPTGLVTKYTYLPGTNLIRTKEICEGELTKISHFYDYDSDLLLVYESIDDGIAKIIRRTTPKPDEPFFGMPIAIDEFYWDGSKEVPLKKTLLEYKAGALIGSKKIYDAEGEFQFQVFFDYDEKNRLIRQTNAIGQEEIYRYDDVGNCIYHKKFNGLDETHSRFDFSNRVIEKETLGFDGIKRNNQYSYDTKHNLEFETDERGHTTSYECNLAGQRIQTTLPPVHSENGDPIFSIIHQKYDAAGHEIFRRDADGNETLTSYNAYGKPIQIVHPDGSIERNIYYLNGNLKSHTDAKGVSTDYVYDYLDRIVEKKVTCNEKVLSQETFEYTGYHLMAKTDAEKNRTVYTYDLAGRKASETFGGETIFYFYDSMGRQDKTQKGDLLKTQKYDPIDRVKEETTESLLGGLTRKIEYEYDDANHSTSITRYVSGIQAKETTRYDSLSREIEKTNALGFKETTTYADVINDANQTVLQKTHTDAMGLQTIETFDTHNRIAKIEKRKGKTLSLVEKFYNKKGLLTLQIDTIFDPNGTSRQIRTRWEYNEMDRQIKLIEAEGTPNAKITCRSYTVRGELKELIKPDSVSIVYEYNDLGQLVSIISSDGTVNHQMTYNALGHLQTSDDLIRTTDPKGRIKSETFPKEFTLYNSYDSSGRVNECKVPAANCLIGYDYLASDMKKVTRKTINNEELYSHTYNQHDLSGNLQEEQILGHFGLIRYTYNAQSRRTGIHSPYFSQEIQEYDAIGNIRQMKIQQETLFYDYDDLYQLTVESGLFSHTYLYDSLYNRLQKDNESYEINTLNQAVSHLEYDENGNPIRQGETLYKYDALDRLIEIKTPAFIQSFKYDSLHRCLSKTTNGKTLHFLYDGQKEIGSFDENLHLQELRILGHAPHAEIGAAIAIELQEKLYAPIHDLQGNVAALIPADLSEPTHYRYSAFGEEKIDGPTTSPWRFSSKRSDSSTGLVYYGRRFYIPALGRWLTPDPAGFTEGMNLYAFLLNDPLVNLDLYGLVTFDPDGWKQYTWEATSWNRSISSSYTHNFSPSWNDSKKHCFNHNLTSAFPSVNPLSTSSPHLYVNGIRNTAFDNFVGAVTLSRTFGYKSNVIPIYSESFGAKDLWSVYKTKKTDYTSPAVRSITREIKFHALCMDALNDPRKIFLTAFSRGVADTYHAVKNLSEAEKNRLIITTCGGIMMIPRSFGFITRNLISHGDWCSKVTNGIVGEPEVQAMMLGLHRKYSNVTMLKQIDGFDGFNRDHFFISKTYQGGLKEYVEKLYDEFGVIK